MKQRNPKTLPLIALPAYFDELVQTIEKTRTNHVKEADIQNLKNASADLKEFVKTAVSTIQEMHDAINLTGIINN